MIVFVESNTEHGTRNGRNVHQQRWYLVQQPASRVENKNYDTWPHHIKPNLPQRFHIGGTLRLVSIG